MAETARAALSVRGLEVSFATAEGQLRAVRGVDYLVRQGECLGIVGESGSGKSVCVTAALGLLDKSARWSGSIEIAGRALGELDEEARRAVRGRTISMIFQEPSRSFDPIYSIGKTFEETFRAKDRGMKPAECAARAVELLSEVHIPRAEERLKNFPHQFSGGMLQRIMIALALANDPEILVADEPTTALDVTIQAQIAALLKELQLRRSLALIFISHDLRLVGQIADRIIVMYGGLVLESGPSADVLKRPHSPYTRALLNSVPEWGRHYAETRLPTIAGTVPDPVRPEPGCPFEPRCSVSTDLCSKAVPAMVRTEEDRDRPLQRDSGGRHYRCVVPGEKA